MKIIYLWDHQKEIKPFIEADIQKWRDAGYDVTEVMHRYELGISGEWEFAQLDKLYKEKEPKLMALYEKIRTLSQTHDVLIVGGDPIYHPEFIKSLKNIYTVIVTADDPESSDRCSRPYVGAFDHSFTWGVTFDKNIKTTEKFLEWGAKRADWWPYGFRDDMYDPKLTVEDITSKERDIDLVYVGTPWLKLERIVKIKEAFPNITIYGRGWDWKIFLREFIYYKNAYGRWDFGVFLAGVKALFIGLPGVKKLPMEELASLYQRSKIGINIHQSYDCATARLFQLPANGVMQICDCPEGLGQVFEVGKEVVLYHSIDEAIKQIKYYLEHDDERKKIAVAGFNRAMKDYKRINTFLKAIEKIKKGMLADGIRSFKDGSPIKV